MTRSSQALYLTLPMVIPVDLSALVNLQRATCGVCQHGFMPKNTEVNTLWAVRNFQEWRTDYNSHHAEQPCPKGVLLTDSLSKLSLWLQKYVLGTRKKDQRTVSAKICPSASLRDKSLHEREKAEHFQHI